MRTGGSAQNQSRPLEYQEHPCAALLRKHAEGRLVVTSVGAGYVGALSTITMACKNPQTRFKVCDINEALIQRWNAGDLPFFEPQLDEYFQRTKHEIGNIEFTSDVAGAIAEADIIFICVNTPALKLAPEQPCGTGVPTDMRAFTSVVSAIGAQFDPTMSHKVIVEKSTVPVGTASLMQKQLQVSIGPQRCFDQYFTLVNMPEFLAEGTAINDLIRPQRVVIGTSSDAAFAVMCSLCQGSDDGEPVRVLRTSDTGSSELGKLMCNAMLAQRVSAVNSVTALCEMTPGCDIREVKEIVASESRIGGKYLQCSPGFGGSCFEKDLQSLIYILGSNGLHDQAAFWQSVLTINHRQKTRLAELVLKGEAARGEKTKIAVFGFSYKQNTSDTRDTPAASIVAAFAKWGFEVAVHDPQVTQAGFEIEMHAQGYGRLVAGSEENNDSGNQELRGSVELVGADKIKACTGASAVVILTEWEIFKTYDYRELVEVMGSKGSRTLYDFRGILPDEVFSSKESPFDRSF